jgi:hypothetical protein
MARRVGYLAAILPSGSYLPTDRAQASDNPRVLRLLRSALTSAVACAAIACGERAGERTDSQAARRVVRLGRDVLDACEAIKVLFRKSAATRVSLNSDSIPALTGGGMLEGCVVQAEGTLGGAVTVPYLASALPDSLGPGWTRDSTMAADGPRGTAYAVSRGNARCLFRIGWTMRVRYDTKEDPPPYTASVACAPIRARGSVP